MVMSPPPRRRNANWFNITQLILALMPTILSAFDREDADSAPSTIKVRSLAGSGNASVSIEPVDADEQHLQFVAADQNISGLDDD